METDETIRQHFDSLPTAPDRNTFLRTNGVRVKFGQGGYWLVESTAFASLTDWRQGQGQVRAAVAQASGSRTAVIHRNGGYT